MTSYYSTDQSISLSLSLSHVHTGIQALIRHFKAGNATQTRQSVACNVRRHPVFEHQNTITTLE